ncbi:MAG: M48 family metallopeptidase [Pseudomonadota bacterium]
MSDQQVTMSRREIIRGLACGSVFAFTGGCTYNQELGRSQFMMVSRGQMAQLAGTAWTDLKRQERVSTNSRYTRRLDKVAERVVLASGENPSQWEYEVFESESINAFALPGNKIGFYTGIIDIMDNDAQVATVAGHEVAHVKFNHSGERYSQALAAQAGLTAASVAVAASDSRNYGWAVSALGLGVQFGVLLPFSRRHELEADRFGVRYMHRAGYEPREALRFWERMSQQGGNKPPEYMSTHPSDETRIAQLRREIALLPPRPTA